MIELSALLCGLLLMAKPGVGPQHVIEDKLYKKKRERWREIRGEALETLKSLHGETLEVAPESYVDREVEKAHTGGRPKYAGKPQCGLCLRFFRDVYDRKYHMLFHKGNGALICIICHLEGKPPHQCYFLNGDSHRRHMNRHGIKLEELKNGDKIDRELSVFLLLIYPIATDLFNQLQITRACNQRDQNPYRWIKVTPKNPKIKDPTKSKYWIIQWNTKDKKTGKFETQTVHINSIQMISGAIWGVKFYCEERGFKFEHKHLDRLVQPAWYSAYKREYEILKILRHLPKNAKNRAQTNYYKVAWMLGEESTEKSVNLNKCEEVLSRYWNSK